MPINKILKDYTKTKRHIASAVLSAYGWSMHKYDAVAVDEPSVFIYFYDMPTNYIWMMQIVRSDFIEISTMASGQPKLKKDYSDALAEIIYQVAGGITPKPINGITWEHLLGMLLASYAGTTSAWIHADAMRNGGHFIVMNYRKSKNDKDSLLRPFAILNTGHTVLPASTFQEYLTDVIKNDKDKHPEWF